MTTDGPVGAPERPEEDSAAPPPPAPDERTDRHDSFASVFLHNL